MSKRRAGVELTHDNWDQEEEAVEEAGTFTVADKATLSKRPMIKAKRRVTEQQDGSPPPAQTPFAAFKGFSGFGGATQPSTASFGFKPVSTASSSAPKSSNVVSFSAAAKPLAEPSFSFKPSAEKGPSMNMFSLSKTDTDSKASSNGSAFPTKSENRGKGLESYADEIKALNRSVSAWIQKHVETNPVCDLTPIFEDYKKHLGEIEEKQAKRREEAGGAAAAGQSQTTKPQLATVSPLMTDKEKSSSSAAATFKGFTFGGAPAIAESEKAASSAPKVGFGFGGASSDNKGFGFGSSSSSSSTSESTAAKFSFGDLSKATTSSKDTEQEEESDEPPKAEVKVIEEKDSLYSTRCKVFYKKGTEFKERGVGMLHLKDTGGSGQILVRADTTLGNVILNIGVSSSMLPHFTKQGKNKNNIMMLSPLNPPADKKCPQCKKNYVNPQESTACEGGCTPTPAPLLLRVKSEADADKLIAEIKKICED